MNKDLTGVPLDGQSTLHSEINSSNMEKNPTLKKIITPAADCQRITKTSENRMRDIRRDTTPSKLNDRWSRIMKLNNLAEGKMPIVQLDPI